jgi:hypothetical protein
MFDQSFFSAYASSSGWMPQKNENKNLEKSG